MAERLCRRCRDLTDCTNGLCRSCRNADNRAADAKRPTARQRGYDSKWERTRKRKLALDPICQRTDCDQPATDVDHIDGLGPNGPAGHDLDNLRSLCHPHHSQRTASDQPGGWHRRP